MSKSDNDAKEIPRNATGEAAVVSTEKNDKEKQGNGSSGPIFLFFLVGVFASLIVGWVIFPKLLYSQKKQPIDFNHVIHVAEVENECEPIRVCRNLSSALSATRRFRGTTLMRSSL
jgi:hypothetical protein